MFKVNNKDNFEHISYLFLPIDVIEQVIFCWVPTQKGKCLTKTKLHKHEGNFSNTKQKNEGFHIGFL